MKTVKQYATPEDYDIFSEVMKSHQRSSIGNGTIEYYMLQDYKKPKNFESFLYVNHVLQAEGINRIGSDAVRRRTDGDTWRFGQAVADGSQAPRWHGMAWMQGQGQQRRGRSRKHVRWRYAG